MRGRRRGGKQATDQPTPRRGERHGATEGPRYATGGGDNGRRTHSTCSRELGADAAKEGLQGESVALPQAHGWCLTSKGTTTFLPFFLC